MLSAYVFDLDILSKELTLNCQSSVTCVTQVTRCVCETLMPPKRPFFEKCNLDI